MKKFKDVYDSYQYLNEIAFVNPSDYKYIDVGKTRIGKMYAGAFSYLYNARKIIKIALFNVGGKEYYCILIMRDQYIEPHFGVFIEDSFEQLVTALNNQDSKKINELINSENLVQKDGYTKIDAPFIKIIGYVFTILCDYLNTKEIGFVRIMGNPKKYSIYSKIVKANIGLIPYKIIDENVDAYYENKDGDRLNAKAIILKYKFA